MTAIKDQKRVKSAKKATVVVTVAIAVVVVVVVAVIVRAIMKMVNAPRVYQEPQKSSKRSKNTLTGFTQSCGTMTKER